MLAMIAESGSNAGAATAVGLSGVLLMIGVFLKNRTPLNPEWIPLILVLIAIPSYIIMVWPVDFNSVVMAVGSAFSAVGLYESAKATKAAPKVGIRNPAKPKTPRK